LATSRLAEIAAAQKTTEKEVLVDALRSAKSIDGAAAKLGMFPNSIRQAMRKHKLRLVRSVEAKVVEDD
jgi:transcriptional regulator with GAF, ATPase, and Fis domain